MFLGSYFFFSSIFGGIFLKRGLCVFSSFLCVFCLCFHFCVSFLCMLFWGSWSVGIGSKFMGSRFLWFWDSFFII